MQRGLLDPEKEDPFSLFVASTNIRYCYYADTHKILGNTYGMLVLQASWGSHSPLCCELGGDVCAHAVLGNTCGVQVLQVSRVIG